MYRAAKVADTRRWCRREVAQAKPFCTEAALKVVSEAMRVLGGIGHTNICFIERLFPDAHLVTILTGSNEIQRPIVQKELFKEVLSEGRSDSRDVKPYTPGVHKVAKKGV